jgi:hypothetical protein
MKTTNIYFTATGDGSTSEVQYRNPIYIKGASTVNFVLTGIGEEKYTVNSATISWGDGTPVLQKGRSLFFDYKTESIFDEVLYGKLGGSVLTVFSHTFTNDTRSYGAQYNSEIVLTRINGTAVSIYQPILIFWDSYYDTVEELSILNTQIQPLSTNQTFTNLESKQEGLVLPSILDSRSPELKTYQ